MTERAPVDPSAWVCPAPLRTHERIVLGHGGGGAMSAELVEHLFVPSFGAAAAGARETDAALLQVGAERLALSTDTYVVRPLFFPGGSIGDLAVNGTVNDLAMMGAAPLALSAAFVLEEGLELVVLARVARDMGAAAGAAGVELLTGDTKVVESGHGDGVYVNTAGIGRVREGVDVRPQRAAEGDVVIVSGPVGMHGIAVMSVREGLQFGTELCSDTAPLAGLVDAMIDACPDPADVHVMRDPTRGGVAAVLCELAESAGVGVEIDELAVPVPAEVDAACELLGLDPLQVASEGRLIAFVAPAASEAVLGAMRSRADGARAAAIGRVVAAHPGTVTARTRLGATRILDRPIGEQLPRIC